MYCDTCLHKEVCGIEGNNESAIKYCADKLESQTNSVLEDIKAEIKTKAKECEFYLDAGHPHNGLYEALKIIDKHKAESEYKE